MRRLWRFPGRTHPVETITLEKLIDETHYDLDETSPYFKWPRKAEPASAMMSELDEGPQ